MLQEANSVYPREKASRSSVVTRRAWPPDDGHVSHWAPGRGCCWHDGWGASSAGCRHQPLVKLGGHWGSSFPEALAVPHNHQGTFTDGCAPMEGLHCLQAMLPHQPLDNDGFALMTNSASHMLLIILSFAFWYAPPLPEDLFLSDFTFISSSLTC